MNILFYGNCQLFAVLKTLNLNKTYKVFHVECWSSDIIKKQYFTDTIQKCDVIITQPINDNYRDVDYLSTSYIIKTKKPNSKLIIFDSCYFNFYYFDLKYINFNNELLRKPIDYHYNKMIECYINNKSVEHYITHVVNNVDLKSSKELDTIAQNSIEELYNRYQNNKEKYNQENTYLIATYDYIKNNYKNKLLFYSMNHPTKYVIQFICEQIINILQIQNSIDYKIDILNTPKCILYKCISKNVNFNINKEEVLTLDIRNIKEITQLYYDTYKKIELNDTYIT
jgi:hypothetical protein